MTNTKVGRRSAGETNKRLYGNDFYKRIGKVGGHNGHTDGFYVNRKLASIAGRKGGLVTKADYHRVSSVV